MYKEALCMMLLIIPGMAQDHCRAVTFQKPLRGYRCTTENYTTIMRVPKQQCTHLCMEKNCTFINYKHTEHYCQMGFEDCAKMIADPEFTVTTTTFPCLPFTRSSCIHWVPISEVIDDKDIPCDPSDTRGRIGRLVLQSDILVGKFYTKFTIAWRDGVSYRNANETEVFQLEPGCSAVWVAYTPGDPLPDETVIGGYVGEPSNRTPIIRGLASNGISYRCGYYNPETQRGYIVHSRPEVVTEMYILVLAGHCWCDLSVILGMEVQDPTLHLSGQIDGLM